MFLRHSFPAARSAAPDAASPHPSRVLVAGAPGPARAAIADYLSERRCSPFCCTPEQAPAQLARLSASVVILDLRGRAYDDLEFLRSVRDQSRAPLIMLGGQGKDAFDRALALELGADDVMAEPLDLRELLARARAILRRQELARRGGTSAPTGGYRFEGWELRRATRVLTDPAGQVVPLSRAGFALLVALLEAPRRVLSRAQLIAATRAHDDAFDRSVDVQVLRLRRKLEADPRRPRLVRTERGVGYVLDAAVERLF
ncbi:winged helix-turn-helix domain-containing protein [Caulobacter segnis]|uniref:winged helix-turn-helix domain-containing protein n=1 Tax=Caulobacter segnis TaxID=88688 RepID=UPI0024105023|nr:winged helix-turn-helix domain-containing protein [Caulobacter segnis]MDG2520587.1 winged helix-turn-helix domain-containing protein [Caulobacter segnis]